MEPTSLASPPLAANRFFSTVPPGKPDVLTISPQRYVLIPLQPVNVVTFEQKRLRRCEQVKDLERQRLSWMTGGEGTHVLDDWGRGDTYTHKCPNKRGAEGGVTQKKEQEVSQQKREAGGSVSRQEAGGKGSRRSPEARKARK